MTWCFWNTIQFERPRKGDRFLMHFGGIFKLSFYNQNGDVPEKLSIEGKTIWLKFHYVFLWPALYN